MQNLIKTINKYIDLSVRDIDTIKQLVTVKNLNEGDFFLKSGYICNEFAFVNKGFEPQYIQKWTGRNFLF